MHHMFPKKYLRYSHLVGGIPTFLKNMSSSLGMTKNLMWKNHPIMFQPPPTRQNSLASNFSPINSAINKKIHPSNGLRAEVADFQGLAHLQVISLHILFGRISIHMYVCMCIHIWYIYIYILQIYYVYSINIYVLCTYYVCIMYTKYVYIYIYQIYTYIIHVISIYINIPYIYSINKDIYIYICIYIYEYTYKHIWIDLVIHAK